jgi:GTPase SAR1 family protein
MGCTSSKEQPEAPPPIPPVEVSTIPQAVAAPSGPPAAIIMSPQAQNAERQRMIDMEISEQQKAASIEDEEKVKLLLLGTGESGKSTIFKQMRILYGSPKTDDDLRMYGVIVRSNIVTAVRKLCLLTRQLGYEKKLDEESKAATAADLSDCSGMTPREAYDQIIAYLVDNTAPEPFPDIPKEQSQKDWVGRSNRAGIQANLDAQQFLQHVEAIRVLWQSATIQDVWMKRAQANINDSHNEYLSDLTRIADTKYIPTEYDILISRVRTTQVTVERYIIDQIQFEVYDVGGQRSERRKWVNCFENVDAVIFVAALSEYDQTLAEAKRHNRMIEALNLFESVVKNANFADTSIMLFLNKKDIFAEKILYSNIADSPFFSDYAGPPKDFDHGVLYFIQKFEEHLEEDEFNDSFIHVTCATDTDNMEFVLDSSRTIIMTDNLRRAGFLGCD